jgi:hypothetical protein
LLVSFAAGFFLLRAGKIPLVLALVLIFRCAGFFQSNSDGLPPAFHLATLSTAPAFEFTVLELMHDTSGRFSLSG